MKTILVSILVSIIVAVGGTIIVSKKHWKEKAKTETKDDFLSVPTYSETPSTSTTTYGASYWFIVVQKDNGTLMNSLIKQDHSYFSVSEAKANFNGKVFILNFIKVDKETYDKNQ
jgi:hypothetical protein